MSIRMWGKTEEKRFSTRAVACPLVPAWVRSLADYLGVLGGSLASKDRLWFRGHGNIDWELVPSALRFTSQAQRDRALDLLPEFKRVAEIKQARPPRVDDELGWHQVAQHFGLPTRLLDWSENLLVALYFACEESNSDGMVFVLNPIALNQLSYPRRPRILDSRLDEGIINKYLRLDGRQTKGGLRTVAINPVWNSERLMLQRGAFTLHGSRDLQVAADTPSLAGIPISRESKPALRVDLERVGIDEMTIFPELEHACRHLRRRVE